MARITDISFGAVGTKEGCTCDRCGLWIKNIWTVKFDDGITAHFGIDCYEQMCKNSRLNDYGMKLMKKTMKRLTDYTERIEREKSLTEETDIAWQNDQRDKESYWCGRQWIEYHEWMINDFFPSRIADVKKDLHKFKNIDFKR